MDLSLEEQMQLQVDERMSKLRQKVEEDMVRVALRRVWTSRLAKGDMNVPPLLKQAVEKYGISMFVKEQSSKNKWFITISAKDNIDPVRFFNQMEKALAKQKLQGSGSYVLEQRSEPGQDPYGYHIHWRVEFLNTCSKSVYAQQVYQCFKLFVAAPNYIDLKPWNDNQIQYMRGQKQQDKMLKVE